MRALFTVAALLLVCCEGRRAFAPKFLQSEVSEAEKAFIDFILKFRRSYGTREEYDFRLEAFTQIYEMVQAHNEGEEQAGYTLGINEFADMTDYEYGWMLGYVPRSEGNLEFLLEEDMDFDENGSVDWVSKGAVTGVKDQKRCGSCWAFSATGSLEGAYYLKHKSLKSFSEQELVDCDRVDGGCNGGHYANAFDYALRHGSTLEKDYPYQGTDGHSCRSSSHNSYSTIGSYKAVKRNSESALMSAINKGPVSVSIDANSRQFSSYAGGIFDSCGTNLDHAVLAVGYGTSNGKGYYKVKNSWGTGWGEKGYIRIARKGDGKGVCGIQMDAYLAQL